MVPVIAALHFKRLTNQCQTPTISTPGIPQMHRGEIESSCHCTTPCRRPSIQPAVGVESARCCMRHNCKGLAARAQETEAEPLLRTINLSKLDFVHGKAAPCEELCKRRRLPSVYSLAGGYNSQTGRAKPPPLHHHRQSSPGSNTTKLSEAACQISGLPASQSGRERPHHCQCSLAPWPAPTDQYAAKVASCWSAYEDVPLVLTGQPTLDTLEVPADSSQLRQRLHRLQKHAASCKRVHLVFHQAIWQPTCCHSASAGHLHGILRSLASPQQLYPQKLLHPATKLLAPPKQFLRRCRCLPTWRQPAGPMRHASCAFCDFLCACDGVCYGGIVAAFSLQTCKLCFPMRLATDQQPFSTLFSENPVWGISVQWMPASNQNLLQRHWSWKNHLHLARPSCPSRSDQQVCYIAKVFLLVRISGSPTAGQRRNCPSPLLSPRLPWSNLRPGKLNFGLQVWTLVTRAVTSEDSLESPNGEHPLAESRRTGLWICGTYLPDNRVWRWLLWLPSKHGQEGEGWRSFGKLPRDAFIAFFEGVCVCVSVCVSLCVCVHVNLPSLLLLSSSLCSRIHTSPLLQSSTKAQVLRVICNLGLILMSWCQANWSPKSIFLICTERSSRSPALRSRIMFSNVASVKVQE